MRLRDSAHDGSFVSGLELDVAVVGSRGSAIDGLVVVHRSRRLCK